MTFIELVEKISENTGIPKRIVKKVLHHTSKQIKFQTTFMGGEIKWVKLGKFSQRKTRGGKAFGHALTPRPTIKFTPYEGE